MKMVYTGSIRGYIAHVLRGNVSYAKFQYYDGTDVTADAYDGCDDAHDG